MPDKTQWPKSTHDFFMHPPLLKPVAGRPKTERHKGNSDKKRSKGQHQCPICMDYGHHWHNCKRGRPEDIAAMKAIKGEPKKRAKNNKCGQSSIMPLEEEAPSASMSFPPSQRLETTAKKKRKCVDCTPETSKSQSLEASSKKKGKYGSSNSGASKRSRSGSNQPEALSIDFPPYTDQPGKAKAKKKVTFKRKKKDLGKEAVNKPKVVLDSPAMGTRSKTGQPPSPAMSTRSKRRLSL